MSEKIAEAYVEISAKMDKLNAQLGEIKAKVERTAKDSEEKFKKTRLQFDSKPLLAGLASLTAAFSALAFLKRSFADWSEQERASSRLGQALKNAGLQGKYLASTQREMEEFSSSLQKVTAYGDEAVTEVQAMLVAMTGMTGRAVRPLTTAVLDLASGLNMDVQSAAVLVSKTLEGMDALSRYGISVKGAKSESEKMAIVISQVAEKFGGFAENELTTTAGKMKNFQNQIGEIRESFGQLLSQALLPITPALLNIANLLGKTVLGALVGLQKHFAQTFATGLGLIVGFNDFMKKTFNTDFIPDAMEVRMKRMVEVGLKMAGEAKVKLDEIWNGPAAGLTFAGPEKPPPAGAPAKGDKEKLNEILKQRLDAARALMAAQNRLAMEAISDEEKRERAAAENRMKERLKELEDKNKLERMDARALADEKLAIETEYQADLEEIQRKGRDKRKKVEIKEVKEWEDTHKHMAWAAQDSLMIIDGEWTSALQSWIAEGKSFADATAHMWTNMANQIIISLMRIGTQYMMLLAAKEIFSGATGGFGGFLINALGGHTGGTFMGGPGGVRRMGSGGSFMVPQGFNNDSFPLMVESGERVTVTPASRVGAEDRGMSRLIGRVDALSMALLKQRSGSSGLDVTVRGEIRGQDVYMTNKKAGRVYSRTR